MNKKAQGQIDWDNPFSIVYLFIVLIVVIFFLGLLSQITFETNCKDVINEKNTCCSNANYWKEQYDAMNESIANCSNLIQEQIDVCDNKINESVNDCKINLESHQNYIVVNKIFFIIYHVLVIFLYLPLTINLFKITFKIGLGEKWEKLKKWYKKTFLVIRIILWIILTLGFISYIYIFLSSKPI